MYSLARALFARLPGAKGATASSFAEQRRRVRQGPRVSGAVLPNVVGRQRHSRKVSRLGNLSGRNSDWRQRGGKCRFWPSLTRLRKLGVACRPAAAFKHQSGITGAVRLKCARLFPSLEIVVCPRASHSEGTCDQKTDRRVKFLTVPALIQAQPAE